MELYRICKANISQSAKVDYIAFCVSKIYRRKVSAMDNKTIKEDLFDTVAKSVAESFKGKNKKGFDIGVTSTQLRRIFEEVKRFEQILLSSEEQWEKQLPYIKMIKSKVAYTVARASKQKSDEKGVYKNLEVFISSCIDLIKKQEDYHIFVILFEAAYGFYYDLAPKSCQ